MTKDDNNRLHYFLICEWSDIKKQTGIFNGRDFNARDSMVVYNK